MQGSPPLNALIASQEQDCKAVTLQTHQLAFHRPASEICDILRSSGVIQKVSKSLQVIPRLESDTSTYSQGRVS